MTAIHPQVRSLIASATGAQETEPADLMAMRAAYLETAIRLGGAIEEVQEAEDVVIARPDGSSLRGRVYVPRVCADPLGAIVWHHGGGWMIGDLDGFDRVGRSLANAAGHVVVSVDYRLAPEHPYPAAVDDGELAVRWTAGEGAGRFAYDGARVAVGGDSAGGQIAVGAALRTRELLLAQLLVYPALDHEMGSDAYRLCADSPMLNASEMAAFWAAYVSGDETVAPLGDADLPGLPPAWIAVAGHDPLRDDGLAYAERLRAAGVAAETIVYEDMVHGFLRWGGVVDRAAELVRWLAAGARSALGAAG